mmetsp:Transcript_33923/g.41816  ORF Transcript_33923/g.41816 Transcript_33923/m.41816 type:complete len:122 (+) Transcript_33923:263-628(+)|eukprot:CAMPEP_0204832136 /NCGR_PEP_ID=MMETSP1346-20131115/12834_1 /ASSEMBLY_ACC=CAM_ASM_000771 /TAXON_ID=215587 /ORGANISM="Aplanochytrium stocchinoi, Strain GSBS06" /LENGTH=121 /DNA_ID=CAMNT_0051963771 /DNA_START=167 /DNA_END=532 /DNA_ORIENTATION=+
MEETARELLSSHETEATFKGFQQGKEPLLKIYPPRPAKQWATFKIDKYINYEKPGKYGDAKAENFRCVAAEQSEEVAETISQLEVGQKVKLSWNHDYVTRTSEQGMTSKSPQRVVILLERM